MKIIATGKELNEMPLVAISAAQAAKGNIEVEFGELEITVTPTTTINEVYDLLKTAEDQKRLAEEIFLSKVTLFELSDALLALEEGESINVPSELKHHLEAAMTLNAIVEKKIEEICDNVEDYIDFTPLINERAQNEPIGDIGEDACPPDCPCQTGEPMDLKEGFIGGVGFVDTSKFPSGTPPEAMIQATLQEYVERGILPCMPDGVIFGEMPSMPPSQFTPDKPKQDRPKADKATESNEALKGSDAKAELGKKLRKLIDDSIAKSGFPKEIADALIENAHLVSPKIPEEVLAALVSLSKK